MLDFRDGATSHNCYSLPFQLGISGPIPLYQHNPHPSPGEPGAKPRQPFFFPSPFSLCFSNPFDALFSPSKILRLKVISPT